MKKLLLSIVLFTFFSMTLSAQWHVGGGLAYGTRLSDNYGLGVQARAIYAITDEIRAGADFIFYLSELDGNGGRAREFNINGHYDFSSNDDMMFYGLAGLNFANIKVGAASFSETGINGGAGLRYHLNDNLVLIGEARYVLFSDLNQLALSANMVYGF